MGKTKKFVNQDHIGLRVRELRVGRDWTQADLRGELQQVIGEPIGINWVTTLEREGTWPSMRYAVALAKIFDCSLDYLAGLTDDPTPVTGRDEAPPYISPEAEQVASVVDQLPAELRAVVLAVADKTAAAESIRREKESATYRRTLQLIEQRFGVQERRRIEFGLEHSGPVSGE